MIETIQPMKDIDRIRSPIVYFGSKYRLIPYIWKLIPDDTKVMVSPFFGGGSLELNLSYYQKIKVFAYDNNKLLINFWKHFLDDPKGVITDAKKLCFDYTRKELIEIQKEVLKTDGVGRDPYDVSVYFYLFNRLGFSNNTYGRIIEYQIDGQNIYNCRGANMFPIDDWKYVPYIDIEVGLLDFKQTLLRHRTEFCYLDPPYVGIENIYGKGKQIFDHHTLNLMLKERENWIGSYGEYPELPFIRYAYQDFTILDIPNKKHLAHSKQKYNQIELLVCSDDIRLPQLSLFSE